MIKTIKMRSCATYDNDGANIEDCVKINFLYGANGSGKSTIGNYLESLSGEVFCDCEIVFEGDVEQDIIVYNRNFRKEHILMGDIPGVFTLGKATKEAVELIKSLKEKRDDFQKELRHEKEMMDKNDQEREDRKKSVKEALWNGIYKKYEKIFPEAFNGMRNSKDKLYSRILELFRLGIRTTHNLERLHKVADTLKGEDFICKTFIEFPEESLNAIDEIESHAIWKKIIIGNEDLPIGNLIKELNNSDWVNKGRLYIRGGICPFCQSSTISDSLKQQIDEYFSGEYKKDLTLIGELKSKYSLITDKLQLFLTELMGNDERLKISELNINELKALIDSIRTIADANRSEIDVKLNEPGRKTQLALLKMKLEELFTLLRDANKKIKEHNHIVNDREATKKKLIKELWEFFVEEQHDYLSEFWRIEQSLAKMMDGLQKKCGELRDRIRNLDAEISDAERNVTSVQPAIDEINQSLYNFGFTGFKIVPSKQQSNFYQIQRENGTLVENTLSEGEETFITFLYFMQMCKGARDVNKVSSKRILVIDDPICSLDSNILFVVSSIIKALIENIRKSETDVEQLFILTHNVYFHRETSYINGRTKEVNDTHYWILRKNNNISQIKSYGRINPISSSYELLWTEIREDKGSYIGIRNAMRRILESYFSLLAERWDEALLQKFDVLEEKIVCKALLGWVNEGSHVISDDLYVDDNPDVVQSYKNVFHKIFIHMGHEAHYNMMMKINP